MDVARLVRAVLHLTCLDFADGFLQIHRDRAELRVRHESARTENLTEAADRAHHVGRSDSDIEVEPAALDLLHDLIRADEVSSCCLSLSDLLALCKDEHALGLARAMRQDKDAAHLLIRILRIDAKAHMQLDGLVEFGRCRLLDEFHRFLRSVELAALDQLRSVLVFLTKLCHE